MTNTPYQQALVALANRLPPLRAQGTPLSPELALVELELRTLVQQDDSPRPDQVETLLSQIKSLRCQDTPLVGEIARLELDLRELAFPPGTGQDIRSLVEQARSTTKRLALRHGDLIQAIEAGKSTDKIVDLMRARDATLEEFNTSLNQILERTTTPRPNEPNPLLELDLGQG